MYLLSDNTQKYMKQKTTRPQNTEKPKYFFFENQMQYVYNRGGQNREYIT